MNYMDFNDRETIADHSRYLNLYIARARAWSDL